jgi:hypothetical protein
VGNPVPFLVLPFWESGLGCIHCSDCRNNLGSATGRNNLHSRRHQHSIGRLNLVPPPGGTIWDRSYLRSIGWNSLGPTPWRNNLCLLSSLICVSWENCSPLVGFIWVPGAIRAPAGEILCILGENCSPVVGLIWVPGAIRAPAGGTTWVGTIWVELATAVANVFRLRVFRRATCAPLVNLIWVPPLGGTIWDYLPSSGRDGSRS